MGAPHESSGAKGINGNQNDKSAYSSGAVYVFTRRGNAVTQQAYIKASNPGDGANFGSSVALSRDGNTLAVAAYYESSNATGINGNQADRSIPEAGAVYIFTRTGSTWSQQAYIKASNTGNAAVGENFAEGDQFGYSIALERRWQHAGGGCHRRRQQRDRHQRRPGRQLGEPVRRGLRLHEDRRHRGRSRRTSSRAMTRPNVLFGYSIGLSENGNTLAVAEYDADRGQGALYVLTRSGGTWSHQARIKADNAENGDSLGYSMAISDDGNTIAAGAADEDCLIPGINPAGCDKDQPMDNSSGAAYVFVRNGTTWTQQAFLKSSNPAKQDWFGVRIAISGDGNTVAVAAPNEDSASKGINGKQDDDTAPEAGAVYYFTRTGHDLDAAGLREGVQHESRATNSVSSLALSGDGRTLLVGARGEDSGAKGINGNQADSSTRDAGAAYLFVR